jgi:predicted O-methyltransferase YrrM
MLKKIILYSIIAAVIIAAEHTAAQGMGDRSDIKTIKNRPIPKTDREKKILDVLEDMYLNQRRGMMNVSPEDGRLLRLLTETTGAKHVVEIGTSNGYSAIWFCLGLLNTGGMLTTHEIDPGRASLARNNFKRAGVERMVTLIGGDAHDEVIKLKEEIDILFLDADKPGYIDYLNKLLPLIRPGGLIVAHNMVYPPPDPGYIKAITTNPDLETIFLHMHAAGVSVTMKKR